MKENILRKVKKYKNNINNKQTNSNSRSWRNNLLLYIKQLLD